MYCPLRCLGLSLNSKFEFELSFNTTGNDKFKNLIIDWHYYWTSSSFLCFINEFCEPGWQRVWSTGSATPRKAKKIQGRSDQIQFSNLKGIRSFAVFYLRKRKTSAKIVTWTLTSHRQTSLSQCIFMHDVVRLLVDEYVFSNFLSNFFFGSKYDELTILGDRNFLDIILTDF